MLYSKLFGKTNKSEKQLGSVNATLLKKAGYVDQVMAGVYTYLPLGLRVLNKIEQIIREEMDKISSEILMPAIVPLQLWQQTKRLDTVDVLMKTTPANEAARKKNDAEYVLSPTHEEVITPLTQKYYFSYKDFPVATYQIQTKFRNEPRVKSGLLRGREFRMKDLYSFHESEEGLKKYYEIVKKAYEVIFDRLGLGNDTIIALASGGDFTEDYSHEFQTRCVSGEDMIFHSKKSQIYYNKEVTPSKAPKIDDSKEELKPKEDVLGKGIIGVEELAEYLKIPVEKTTKTLLFENEKGEIIAAAVRGGYDVSEYKLKKISKSRTLVLTSATTIKKVTKAEVGYAGLLNLPKDVQVFMDESMKGRKNFECGANRTHYHTINVNFGRDIPEPESFYDLKTAKEGDYFPENEEKYEVFKAAEVGNIFPLYTKFSEAFGYTYTDEKGNQKPVYMGSYGIGSSRIMGVLVEKFHDEKGIIWPEQVSPFQVHLLGLDLDNIVVNKQAQLIYDKLLEKNIEVLFDDRENVSAGEKFADADLIGIPIRLVISKRTGVKIEFKRRNEQKAELLTLEAIVNNLS